MSLSFFNTPSAGHYGQGCVFIRAVHIVYRYRFVVHSLYRDRYRRYIAVQRAIVRLVRKDIRAIEVRIRYVAQTAIRNSTSSAPWVGPTTRIAVNVPLSMSLSFFNTPSAATTVKVVSSSVLYTSSTATGFVVHSLYRDRYRRYICCPTCHRSPCT